MRGQDLPPAPARRHGERPCGGTDRVAPIPWGSVPARRYPQSAAPTAPWGRLDFPREFPAHAHHGLPRLQELAG